MELADLHIHPSFSIDATGGIEEFAEVSAQRGLKQICFTTHIDLEPERKPIDQFIRINGRLELISRGNIFVYIDSVKRLSEKYKGTLDIRVGLEIGWCRTCEGIIRNFIEGLPVDFKMGSVHIVDGVAVTSRREALQFFRKHGLEYVAQRYFEELTYAAKSGLFNVLGHIDGYKKYAPLVFGDAHELKNPDLVLPLLYACKENNVALELNTSSLRKKGHAEFYPSIWILHLAKEAGIKKFSLGSDSHSPEEVAYEFDRARRLLEELGFEMYRIGKND